MTRYKYGRIKRTPELYLTDLAGNITEDVTTAIRGAAVELNTDRSIAMTFTGDSRFRAFARPFVDFLAPYLTIEYGDGYTVREPLGRYAFAPMSSNEGEGSTRAAIDGRDLSWLLTVDTYDQGYTVSAGTNPLEEVGAIFDSIGVPYSLPSTTKTLEADTSFKPGSNKLEVANGLLGGAGFYITHPARSGWLTSRAWRRLASDHPDTRYATDGTSRTKIVRTIQREPVKDSIYNHVTVIRDDPNKPLIVATATNTSPASPISTTSLGYTIARPPVYDSQLLDEATAQALADRLLEEASSTLTRLTVLTTADNQRGAHEITELDVWNAAGEEIAAGSWWEPGWKLQLERGPMSHNVNKLLPFEAL